LSAQVPGTVAAALDRHGQWNRECPGDIDAVDWWYRTTLFMPANWHGGLAFLRFDGLATNAEVWLNGRSILATDNMFRAYRVEVSEHLQRENKLHIVFRSLSHSLKARRGRPRWKTKLVSHQQLRWYRTTLLGRIPGWSPPVPPIGPWRDIHFEMEPLSFSECHLTSSMNGNNGTVQVNARVDSLLAIDRATLIVGNSQTEARITSHGKYAVLQASHHVFEPELWWPHTHGDQSLSACFLRLQAGGEEHNYDCGKIGFRTVRTVPGSDFGIQVNGEEVYCRGVCWTISDIVSCGGSTESIMRDLTLARDAGVNMVRVGGTMTYEADIFYKICDELGIMIWQDFMFANMDYPFEDETFRANVELEIDHQLDRLSRHPSVTVYCGSSEIEQQAAMLGLPRSNWTNPWFGERLPELCARKHPGTLYVTSSPSGGTLPIHVRKGIAHYYGIGAYKRSPLELRKANVKFTTECLGFANVPDVETLNALAAGVPLVVGDSRWKRGVPRDTGAGWDFDDIRDYYLRYLFQVDPVELRSCDTTRYLQLSRIVSGQLMEEVFSEWRSPYSNNRGGLVWFFKDLQLGAGWGIVDSAGRPKAAYYYLRRCWRNRQLTMTDEGLDGLHLHVVNERREVFHGSLELALFKYPNINIASRETQIEISGRSAASFESDELLGTFYDVTYAYRFGPPNHDLAIATLYGSDREILSESFYFVSHREPAMLTAAKLDAEVEALEGDRYRVKLLSDKFLHNVRLQVNGFLPADNHFHLVPGRAKLVLFTPIEPRHPGFKGSVEALNLPSVELLQLKRPDRS
jgi:beta-mannosidase